MKISKCNVCVFASRTGICSENAVEFECGLFEPVGAEFLFNEDCPSCSKRGSSGLLLQDGHGVYCSIAGCDFEQRYD